MGLSVRLRWFLRVCTWLGLAFLYVPLALVVLNAFNQSRTFAFPPTGLTLKWWHAAANSDGPRTILAAVALATALTLTSGRSS